MIFNYDVFYFVMFYLKKKSSFTFIIANLKYVKTVVKAVFNICAISNPKKSPKHSVFYEI